MEVRLLGQMEVVVGGHPVDIGGRLPRSILAVLSLSANQEVSADRLRPPGWPTATARRESSAGGGLRCRRDGRRRRPPFVLISALPSSFAILPTGAHHKANALLQRCRVLATPPCDSARGIGTRGGGGDQMIRGGGGWG